jgi:hypothetical protein
MQAKYVPRFVSKTQEQVQPAVHAQADAPLSNRWAPLVNTSLPAKQAPILPPSTLANLTKVSIKNTQVKPAPSADDFPTLGVPVAPKAPTSDKPTFSQLSKQWAVQKEEDDKKEKEEAEKIASEERQLRSLKEKDADMARDIRKFGFIPLPAMNRVQLTEPERVRFSDEEDEIDPFDDGMPEEEEEEEDEDDMNWNVRRSQHDLY